MTATQPSGEVQQLVLRSRETEDTFGGSLLTSIPATIGAPIPGVVWYDIRDQRWRGLVPGLSLFAEAANSNKVAILLAEKVATYIEDVQEQGLERDLVPRPLPTSEWRSLRVYFWFLSLRARIANLLFPALAVPMPVVQRVPIYWHK